MTYGQFHLIFNLPPLLALLWLNGAVPPQPGEWFAALAVLGIVVCFTSPWDNDAVRRGIWGFPAGRYLFRIGWLPVEEYLFFIWQSVNVMLSVRWLLLACPEWKTGLEAPWTPSLGVGMLALLAVWAFAGWLIRCSNLSPNWNYAVHLLFWFLPVFAVLSVLAPDLKLAHAKTLCAVGLAWGAYYTLADLAAVRRGVWFFDEKQITGVKLAGVLPWEEIAFFYLTSFLVAESYLVFLPPALR